MRAAGMQQWRVEASRAVSLLKAVLPGKLRELPDPSLAGSLAAWEQLWVRCPGQWAGLIRLFFQRSATRTTEVQAILVARGFVVGAEVEVEQDLMCMDCGACFSTMQRMRSHRIHRHGVRRPVRQFCITQVCPVCGDDHHTRLRALRHLERAAACRAAWQGGLIPAHSDEAVAAADAADVCTRRAAATLGIHELSGPPVVRFGVLPA